MRVPDVAFETRDDYSDDRNLEFRAGQVDGDDAGDLIRTQVFELPPEVLTQIVTGKTQNFAEHMGLALLTQGVEQRIDNIGARRLLVFEWQQIIADTGDVSQA